MSGLARWLAGCVDADEALAKAVSADDWGVSQDEDDAYYAWQDLPDAAFAHARRHGPERALAEVAFKQALLTLVQEMDDFHYLQCEGCADPGAEGRRILLAMAEVFKDRPGYQEATAGD